MKGALKLLAVFVLILNFAFLGFCAEDILTSKSAISAAAGLKTVQEKVAYLIAQAKALYNSQKFQEVVNITQYILTNLDKGSLSAKNLLTKAKEQLISVAQQKAAELTARINGFNATSTQP